ncbi:MAG TPA: hypothetical protein VGZ93_11895 [Candidatus Methylacidiphilales bacterium]|jgi:hypothetical protein|nr:hypothetical protein [Candidatus Methylacidiphilales bacterium]
MRSISRLALAALLFVLPGCSFSGAPSWMQGDWIFDLDASQKAMNEPAKPPPGGGGLFDAMANAMGGMLLPAVSGMELRITDKEIMTMMNGNGKAQTYEVVSTVPDQECLIKLSDGTLQTYYKAGDSIYAYPDKGGKTKLFFKRKS